MLWQNNGVNMEEYITKADMIEILQGLSASYLPALQIKKAIQTNVTHKITAGDLYVTGRPGKVTITVCCDDNLWRAVPLAQFVDV